MVIQAHQQKGQTLKAFEFEDLYENQEQDASAAEEIDPSQFQDLDQSSILLESDPDKKGLFGPTPKGIQGINVEELQLRAMVQQMDTKFCFLP